MKLYTPLINKALRIAYAAHHGQSDKCGVPYIFHPLALAEQMETEDEIIAALLHDVVEDTPITLEQLQSEGFSPAVLDALKLLTHQSGADYSGYIIALAENPLAVSVKMADLRHNSDSSRNAALNSDEAARYAEKYSFALRLLQDCLDKQAD